MQILVHICCAPCFAYPHKRLLEEGHSVVGYWYNPNIHPSMEYKARMDSVKKYASLENVDVVYANYDLFSYLSNAVKVMEKERDRCVACYEYRLKKTGEYAKENGFDAFTTTLLVSHQQKHEKIREIGESVSKKVGIPFHYEDFRKGWNQGKAIATQYGLYRQKYCGCIFSEWERYRGTLG